MNLESGAKSRTSVWQAGRLLISVKMFKSNSGAEGVFMKNLVKEVGDFS